MASSLVKFMGSAESNDRGNLYWGRVSEDGLPFRGEKPPMYRENEYEDNIVKISDPKNGTFDTADKEQNAAYMKVLDGIVNGWYSQLFIDRWRDEETGHYHVYIEWVEHFLEDSKSTYN